MAVNIANDLNKKGVTSFLCSTRKEGLLKNKVSDDVGFIYLNRKYLIDIHAFSKLYKFLIKNEINIIQAHSTSFFIGYVMKLFVPKIKLIWHNHYGNSLKLSNFKLWIYQIFSKYTFAIISVNNDLQLWASQNFRAKRFIYLYNYPVFSSNEGKTSLEGIEGKRIVNVANLREEKDQINLIKSFLIVKPEHPNWSLHLIGSNNTSYAKTVKEFIKDNNLEKHIFLYGSCLDISNVLNQSTIGVLSSNFEGLPVVLLEYGLAKLPVVATNVGDCNKVIINKKTGLLVKSDDSNELANKLLYLIKNIDKRNEFGKNLHKHIKLNFSKDKYINKLIEVYNA